VTAPTQRPLPDNTQHSEEKGIRALGGIRTRSPNNRAAKDPRLIQRGRWDPIQLGIKINVVLMNVVVWNQIITLVDNLILKVEVDFLRTPVSYSGRPR
jgi:hypothetical protein